MTKLSCLCQAGDRPIFPGMRLLDIAANVVAIVACGLVLVKEGREMLGTTLRVARALAVSVMAAIVVTAAPADTSDYCWDRCDFAAPCDTDCKIDENNWMTCLDWGDCDFCNYYLYDLEHCGNGVCEPEWHGCEYSCSCPEDCGDCPPGHTPYPDECTYGVTNCGANYLCNEDGRCVPAGDPEEPGWPSTVDSCYIHTDCPGYPQYICVEGLCVSEYHWPVSG